MVAFGIFYAAIVTFAFAALALGGRADLRAKHELQSLIGRDGKGDALSHDGDNT